MKTTKIKIYYWKKADGTLVKLEDITVGHAINIVKVFGIDRNETNHAEKLRMISNIIKASPFISIGSKSSKDGYHRTEERRVRGKIVTLIIPISTDEEEETLLSY